MSTADEKKKFVIKHVFNDVSNIPDYAYYYGQKERNHNIPWRVHLYKTSTYCNVYLECLKFRGKDDWSIDARIEVKIQTKTGEDVSVKDFKFTNKSPEVKLKTQVPFETHLVNDSLSIECHVTINNSNGVRLNNLRSFTDESMKKLSDVVLVVENQKFHVNKMYLATHSPYFESLLLGNFDESKQSEVELKDTDAWDFQNFLEVLYGESAINEDTVEGILQLADMYAAKTAIKRCEEFLVYRSGQSLSIKFKAAVKYGLENLKKKCITEMKNADDIESVLPADVTEYDHKVWEELLKHSLVLYRNK